MPIAAAAADLPFGPLSRSRAPSVRHLIKQRLGFFEVGSIESFCEPAVDRPEEIRRSGAVAASNPQPGEDGGGTQFERARSLRACHVQGSHIADLCLSRAVSKQP